MRRPTLFLLHALGGSAKAWTGVIDRLDHRFDCVALDLPGFGDRADEGYVDVATMIGWLAAEVAARRPERWFLVGHSMGGKFATLLAAREQDGSGLGGVVLLAASPPAPEPMAEDRREDMLDWFRDGPANEAQAAEFVDGNSAKPLPEPLREAAIVDVRRSSPDAWTGWLERGSREDWRAAAGVMAMPALIVAGGEDGDLGEAAQRQWNAPHYAKAQVLVVEGAAHLLPLEAADVVAKLIADFADRHHA
ncbi:alpha/beta fold hydrolase [Sphingomonas sanguinis]|jgi:pimeloyl-ACP methyl ester carboxylesterase|uniref:alpha/beta fold hydrolase n=1 Tax=Sphingomonas sanguinis TaxID=33051 RepID=UPI00077BCB21|nr:alpha/beta hydrolase [Sphingomonas sanguinis]MBZ6381340.1 alpha/beta hydrolase [Sphingomonas sanguinis]